MSLVYDSDRGLVDEEELNREKELAEAQRKKDEDDEFWDRYDDFLYNYSVDEVGGLSDPGSVCNVASRISGWVGVELKGEFVHMEDNDE